jgi:DNA-binding phage protein
VTDKEIKFDPEKIAKLQPFSVVDYLNTDEEIAGYLQAVLDNDGDPHPSDMAVLRGAIRDTIAALRKRQA